MSGTMRGILAAPLLLVLAAACCTDPEPIEPNMDAQTVVMRHAQAAFEVHFELEESREPLTRFHEGTGDSRTRVDLSRVWGTIPELAAKGADFLSRYVFSRAVKDGDWDATWSAEETEAAFVSGTRDGLKRVLSGGE